MICPKGSGGLGRRASWEDRQRKEHVQRLRGEPGLSEEELKGFMGGSEVGREGEARDEMGGVWPDQDTLVDHCED